MTRLADRPRVDPRFAQRWIDARRQEGRRRLRLVVCAMAVLAAGALALGSLYTPLFAVRRVHVSVDGAMPASQVLAIAGLRRLPLMIDVDGRAIASRLDADPALGAARVARHWPSTLDISLVVRTPVAVAASASGSPRGWAEIDGTGRVLADVPVAPAGLPTLAGIGLIPAAGGWIPGSAGSAADPAAPPGAQVDMAAPAGSTGMPKAPAAALAFLQTLPPSLRSAVVSFNVGRAGSSTAAGGMTMVVAPPRAASGTVEVQLGDGSELAAKATALTTMLEQADLSGVKIIDLTVPDRPATLTA